METFSLIFLREKTYWLDLAGSFFDLGMIFLRGDSIGIFAAPIESPNETLLFI